MYTSIQYLLAWYLLCSKSSYLYGERQQDFAVVSKLSAQVQRSTGTILMLPEEACGSTKSRTNGTVCHTKRPTNLGIGLLMDLLVVGFKPDVYILSLVAIT